MNLMKILTSGCSFSRGREDPEYLSYQGVINLKIDGKSLSEVLPMCTYVNY